MKFEKNYKGIFIYLFIAFAALLLIIIALIDQAEEREYLSLSKRGYTLTISEFIEKYPEAEIKEVEDKKIAYLKSPFGRHLYLLFEYDEYEKAYTAVATASWYYKKQIYAEDFDSLIIGKSTLNDVLKIDKYCKVYTEFGDQNNIPCSIHHTQDKKDIVIYYHYTDLNYLNNDESYMCSFKIKIYDNREIFASVLD